MNWLKGIAKLLLIIGILIFLCGNALAFFVKNTPDGRALTARWQLTRIFQKHGYQVLWERVLYNTLHPYFKVRVEKGVPKGWDNEHDYTSYVRRHLSPLTFMHVLEVAQVPRGNPLYLFVFEDPVLAYTGQFPIVDDLDQPIPFIVHKHGLLGYYCTGIMIAWDDLFLFPLEHYFSFEEIRGRQLWVDNAHRKISILGLSIGGTCLVLGLGIFVRLHFRTAIVRTAGIVGRVRTLLKKRNDSPKVLPDTIRREDNGTPAHERKNTAIPKEILFLLCFGYLYERVREEEQEERKNARVEQDTLRSELETLYNNETRVKKRSELGDLLRQFPGANHVRLNIAKKLLLQAQTICKGTRVPTSTSPIGVIRSIGREYVPQKREVEKRDATRENPSVLSMRRLHGLLDGIDPYISTEGGDPFVVKVVILWGFVRPTAKISFVAGSYGPVRIIRESIKGKFGAIKKAFGRQLYVEEVDHNIELLKKGNVIIKAGHGKLLYSLNDKENSVGSPWREVITIINRVRWEILSLR